MDVIVFKVREGSKVINKTICIAVSLKRDWRKEVSGLWLCKNESSSFWMSVLTDIKTPGTEDVNYCYGQFKWLYGYYSQYFS